VVDVTDRAHVHVRLGAGEFTFCHFSTPKKTISTYADGLQTCCCNPLETGALCGNRTRDLPLTKGVLYH
jgi:hypothetical protein